MGFTPLRSQYAVIHLLGLVMLPGFASSTHGGEVVVRCQIEDVTFEGVFVNAGRDAQLAAGINGVLRHQGQEFAQVEVVSATSSTALLRLVTGALEDVPERGTAVGLVLQLPDAPSADSAPQAGDVSAPEKPASPTLRAGEDQEGFVPFLNLPAMRNVARTEAQDLLHGRITLRQLFQIDADSLRDYSVTHLRTSGSWLRLGGSPWALEWSGGVSYRDGNALENVRDYEKARFEVLRFALTRQFEDKSFVRLGRFVPRELAAIGYVDGMQGEKTVTNYLRVGAVAGLKPHRTRLDPSADEPSVMPYVTFEVKESAEFYYSGTTGVLGSFYKGEPDRLAFLWDQTMRLGDLSLGSSSEVDFDIGGAEIRDSGARLTRWDLYLSYPLAAFFRARAGLDRYERVDTAAERDIVDLDDAGDFDDDFFDRGYWRYWVGGSHPLPWRLRLSEEVSLTDSDSDSSQIRWRVSLTRTGLPLLPAGSVTLTGYNLESSTADGYGLRLSSHLPFAKHRLSIQPSLTARFMEDDGGGSEDFELTDFYVRANYALTQAWSVFVGVSHSFGSDVERYFLDAGLTYRW